MPKIALINGISMGIFKFYYFLPILDRFLPFLTFSYIWSQIPIEGHMHIYKLCENAKNLTHKWYFNGHF